MFVPSGVPIRVENLKDGTVHDKPLDIYLYLNKMGSVEHALKIFPFKKKKQNDVFFLQEFLSNFRFSLVNSIIEKRALIRGGVLLAVPHFSYDPSSVHDPCARALKGNPKPSPFENETTSSLDHLGN